MASLKDVEGNDFTYGTPLGKLRSQTAHPAIYRWSVELEGKRIKAYVGETELLGRRLYQHLNPGPTQQSNLRLRNEFLSLGTQGYRIFFDIFEFEPFQVNGLDQFCNRWTGNMQDALSRHWFVLNLRMAWSL